MLHAMGYLARHYIPLLRSFRGLLSAESYKHFVPPGLLKTREAGEPVMQRARTEKS
jgi:hypothetical protein